MGVGNRIPPGTGFKITRVYVLAQLPSTPSLLLVGKYLQVPTPVSLWGAGKSNRNNQVLFFH